MDNWDGLCCCRRWGGFWTVLARGVVVADDEVEELTLLLVLDEREQNVLRLRYGLDSGEPMTLKAIGEQIGLTRERVRQMERDAIRKLQATMLREFGEEEEDRAEGPQSRQRRA